jgi:hypothetical protein
MILHEDPGCATHLQGHDAIGRPFSLTHFAGHEFLCLTPHTTARSLHFSRREAATLSRVLAHFARNERLPTRHLPEDWSI